MVALNFRGFLGSWFLLDQVFISLTAARAPLFVGRVIFSALRTNHFSSPQHLPIFASTKYLRSLYSACLPSFHPDTGRWYPITRVQTSQRVRFSSGNSSLVISILPCTSDKPVPCLLRSPCSCSLDHDTTPIFRLT